MEKEYPIINNGTILNGYKILEKLNVNSKNSLYKAERENSDNGQLDILKAYPYETPNEIKNFQNESDIVELLKNNPLFITYDNKFEQKIDVEIKINSRQISQYKKNYMFVVMKYYRYTDLEKATENSSKGSSEETVTNFLFQSLNALKILHSMKIVHHDIKPSNFMIVSEDPLKFALIDFEFAEQLIDDQTTSSILGTRPFLAPEILNDEEHSMSVDIWGLGVSAYKLSEGCYPYKIITKDSKEQIKNKINKNNLKFFSYSKKKSVTLINLLSEMLKKDPSQRITAEKALQSNLFDKYNISNEELNDREENEAELESVPGVRRN